jgi:hypothetical protein
MDENTPPNNAAARSVALNPFPMNDPPRMKHPSLLAGSSAGSERKMKNFEKQYIPLFFVHCFEYRYSASFLSRNIREPKWPGI